MKVKVIKRDGRVVDFDITKITDTIKKAFDAEKMVYDDSMINLLGLNVTSDFQSKVKEGKITVEEIQDSVEKVLSNAGYANVAKAYIIYRKQRENVRNVSETLIDYKSIVDSYVNITDWRVKENSTVTYSVGGMILNNSGAITANYWLSEIYDKEIAEAHRNCDFHLHDLSMLTGYCFTGDTRVKTLDGKNWSFKELVDNSIKELWVYGNLANGIAFMCSIF